MLNILIFGDIVGKIGRKAIKKTLPQLKKKHKADLIIANVENLAHGKGVTEKTLQEMLDAGINFFTSGNHIWKNPAIYKIFKENKFPLIRPANYPAGVKGNGYKIIKINKKKVLIINLLGRTFFHEDLNCPFKTAEKIIKKHSKNVVATIIDFHAEATSEKVVLGHYLNGEASLIFGTHTHVATADEQILDRGTGYITDIGMVGAKKSSLGIDLENILIKFLTQIPKTHEIPEKGICQVNALFAKIDKQGKCIEIKRIYKETNII